MKVKAFSKMEGEEEVRDVWYQRKKEGCYAVGGKTRSRWVCVATEGRKSVVQMW